MTIRSFRRAVAIVAAVTCLAAGAARAATAADDAGCDDILGELNKLALRHMNTAEPKGLGPVCAATGQLLGILRASRETAAECYADGRKLDDILATFDKGIRDIEGKIEQACK